MKKANLWWLAALAVFGAFPLVVSNPTWTSSASSR